MLKIEPTATGAQIKKSFRRLSLEMHPDKRAQHGLQTTADDVEQFRRVKEAYEVLSRVAASSPGVARRRTSSSFERER